MNFCPTLRPLTRLTVLLSLISFSATAQKSMNITTSSVPFLRISPDARSGGMGDIGIATTPDANAAFWNMGKLAFNESTAGAALNYTPWLKNLADDVSLITASGFYKLNEDEAIGITLRYFNLGDIQFTTDGVDNLGSSRPREMSVNLGYSRKLSDIIGLGISLGYIHSSLINGGMGTAQDYKAGTAVAADLGLYADLRDEYDNGFSLGAAFSNLGSKISYVRNSSLKDFLPANFGIGANWQRIENDDHKINIGLEINKLLVPVLEDSSAVALDRYRQKTVVNSWTSSFNDFPGQTGISLGAEYSYRDFLSLRTGYYYESENKGGRQYLTAGIGLTYQAFQLNFSYLNATGNGLVQSPLTNTLRFSLAFNLPTEN